MRHWIPTTRVVDAQIYTDWNHPGGMQLIGDILVVPMEQHTADNPPSHGKIFFYDTRNQGRPVKMNYELDMYEVDNYITPAEKVEILEASGRPRT